MYAAPVMWSRWLRAALGVWWVFSSPAAAQTGDGTRATTDIQAAAPDGATIYRVFLTDGSSLVSYGEPARVGDRIIFFVPTATSLENPPLHVVNLAASRVDWSRTERYAETARATGYFATKAEADYAALTSEISTALSHVSTAADPAARLAIVENARKMLADWMRTHFNYRYAEIAPVLETLDVIAAELRALSGTGQFELTFVARNEAPAVHETLLPLPTRTEAIEQAMLAASMSDVPAERLSLLSAALGALERDFDHLPTDWRRETRTAIRTTIAAELETDRQYQVMTSRILNLAGTRAKAADVRGVQRLSGEIAAQDRALGSKRPDVIDGLRAALETQLDAARKLRLARDGWAIRREDFRTYRNSMTAPLARLERLQGHLGDLKSLAASSPFALAAIQTGAAEATKGLSAIVPPEEFSNVHALFLAAAQLADTAVKIRREAALTGDLRRAWDASSAAAGALMLDALARAQFKNLFQVPQQPQ